MQHCRMNNYSTDHSQGASRVFRCTAHEDSNVGNGMKMLLTPQEVVEVSYLLVPATPGFTRFVLRMIPSRCHAQGVDERSLLRRRTGWSTSFRWQRK